MVDAKHAPELLVDLEVHTEAGVAGENVPAVAVGVQHEAGAFAQEQHRAHADGVDIDDGAIAACFQNKVMVAHHFVRVCCRDAPGVHAFFSGALFLIEDDGHDGFDAVRQWRIVGRHQLLIVFDEINTGFHNFAHEFC